MHNTRISGLRPPPPPQVTNGGQGHTNVTAFMGVAVPFLRLYEVHLLSQGQPPRKGGSRPRSGRIRGEQPTMSLSILNQASCSPSHQPY